MKRDAISAVALGAALFGATSVVAPTPAAAADPCVLGQYRSYTYDYARVTDVSGTCGTVGVRHKYDPVWSSNNYWTSWYYGGSSAQTPSTAELYDAQFSHSAG